MESEVQNAPQADSPSKFSFNNFILESQPEVSMYSTAKNQRIRENSLKVVEQAIQDFKSQLE